MQKVISNLRQMIQDQVSPSLNALQRKVDALSMESHFQHDAMMMTIEAFRAEMRSEFAALRANNQLAARAAFFEFTEVT